MATKVTRETIESYLHCRTKGHLKLAGEHGIRSDYEALLLERREEARLAAIDKIVARHPEGDVVRGVPLTAAALKPGPLFVLDAVLEDDLASLHFDGLKRVDGPSKLGDFHYVPMLFHDGPKVRKEQRLLLEVYGLLLSRVQGRTPGHAIVWHGGQGRATRVRLGTDPRKAERVLRELQQLRDGEPPRLLLNDHCQVCEFRQRCRTQAEQADDISLLAGVGEKELQKYHRNGLFTLTQLSCTFRPRKRNKRVKKAGHPRYAALQALALRERKVHVYGTPDLPGKLVQVFLDAEGSEDASFAYLLGVLVVEGDSQQMHSFWADSPAEEVRAFDAFLDLLDGREDFALLHYGGYERKFLKRMRKAVERKGLVDRALANAVNVLSAIHAAVYFPTFSNGLKEVGRHLGCTWTEADASGLRSLVWRARWERAREPVLKEKLLTYNAEDCAALRKVAEFVQAVGEAARSRGSGSAVPPSAPAVAWGDEINDSSSRRLWCRPDFALEDFDHVNRCAYFDYQREKVFVRTNDVVRRACRGAGKRRRGFKLPPSREVKLVAGVCPRCKGSRLSQHSRAVLSKLAYDLKFTAGGIRRQVVRCTTVKHECLDCGLTFLPKAYTRRDKHLHGLKSWAVYQLVVHRSSLHQIGLLFEDCFGLRVGVMEVLAIRMLMARRYRRTQEHILGRLVAGGLIHVDETEVHLKQGKGYVWVLTSMEDVVYLYRPNREAGFLQGLLRDFKGVLVSDFYPGYESLPCGQQACLVHLIRDLNDDLRGNPYDEAFKLLAGEFGKLLRSVVDTVDRFGLKRHHLHKHKAEVACFFRDLGARSYHSELAEGYRKRLLKNEGRLFTFLDHDNVPWNNNAAEYAIKGFARYRELYDGRMSEEGVSDVLVLLSVQQTCKYRGVGFLKFLLSREEDVGAFRERRRKGDGPPAIEVYPDGFCLTHLRVNWVPAADGEDSRAGPGIEGTARGCVPPS
jgi:predicted RecB family nuclease